VGDHQLQTQLREAKEQLDRLTTRDTEIIPGVSRLLSVREIQVIFMLGYRTTLRLIDRVFRPMGATVKVGRKLLTHCWAVNQYINMTGRCPSCGRLWNGSTNGGN